MMDEATNFIDNFASYLIIHVSFERKTKTKSFNQKIKNNARLNQLTFVAFNFWHSVVRMVD